MSKLYLTFDDLRKIIADEDILRKVGEAMEEMRSFHMEILRELSKELGVEVKDFDWDETEGYEYFDGKSWHKLPTAKYMKVLKRIGDKYLDAVDVVDRMRKALAYLLGIKNGKHYVCHYNERIGKFVCWSD